MKGPGHTAHNPLFPLQPALPITASRRCRQPARHRPAAHGSIPLHHMPKHAPVPTRPYTPLPCRACTLRPRGTSCGRRRCTATCWRSSPAMRWRSSAWCVCVSAGARVLQWGSTYLIGQQPSNEKRGADLEHVATGYKMSTSTTDYECPSRTFEARWQSTSAYAHLPRCRPRPPPPGVP